MKFYSEMLDKLRRGEPFKFSRWGDGEWGCMKGWSGKNRDGNEYTPELRKELKRIMGSHPDYYIGLQYGVLYNEELREFVFSWLFGYDKMNFVNGDVLHQASEFGYLREFVDFFNPTGCATIIIGAEYFSDIPFFHRHIVIPPANSYSENDKIIKEAEKYVDMNPVFLVAAAMNSNIIIDRLPDNVTAIDIGSVFDPYLGRPRAQYQYKMNVTLKDLW